MPSEPSCDQRVAEAIADPTRQFAAPMDVVNDPVLTPQAKRSILESWKKDAELLATAQDENMTGGERPYLQDVSLALGALDTLDKADRTHGRVN